MGHRAGKEGALAALIAGLLFAPRVTADGDTFGDAEVLSDRPYLQVERVQTRITAYSQKGFGYQSQAGPMEGPGSETLHVLSAQGEFVLRQGDRITHRVWVPVDVVTSASANAIDSYYAAPDVISTASAQNVASQAEYQLTVEAAPDMRLTGGAAIHQEENFFSWLFSLGLELSLAEDNATFGVGINQVLDWFDAFTLGGYRAGRASRTSTNLNTSLSQLLSPSTVASIGYGLTIQYGELGNTWNTVPTNDGARRSEELPRQRARHALTLGLAQWLPWQGALSTSARVYADDWGARAASAEAALHQSLGSLLLLGANVRYHRQRAVAFFSTRALPGETIVTADSDLGAFHALTLGGEAEVSLPTRRYGTLFLSVGYDHYFRSDALRVNVVTWASGFRF